MRGPEDKLISILRESGTNFVSTLPCEKIKLLLEKIDSSFFTVPLTREEEGAGISAGAALSGMRPAMFFQNSGIGNMINALLSLTGFYKLPLALFMSWRGVYKERIEAQMPMGIRLPHILRGAGIGHTAVNTAEDLALIGDKLNEVYRKNKIHAFMLSPAVWEGAQKSRNDDRSSDEECFPSVAVTYRRKKCRPEFTRYEILEIISSYLGSKAVVCNLGFPSKELYHIKPQPSNFYMLGSMGMVAPIGLGIALTSGKEVVVIDGDGSILMNPGTLATIARTSPGNLTVLAIDNGSYGSTGNQVTATRDFVDLSLVAYGFGIREVMTVSSRRGIIEAVGKNMRGPKFIHILAKVGNKDLPNIPTGQDEIKRQVMDFLKEDVVTECRK